jgi:deoxyribose-phosphate aldolase
MLEPRRGENMDCNYSYLDIAKMIDHSLLNPVLTDQQLEEGCRLARDYDVASVCVKPYHLKRCAELLAESTVAASTVIGFPHGGHTTQIKVAEAEQALRDGGTELDMVVNIGKVLSGDWAFVRNDVRAVVDASHAGGALVKVIFENCYLEDSHKISLCEICAEVGADFVKTSTGSGSGGATIEDITLMRRHSPPHVRVKAAGGVRTLDSQLEMRAAGAARCGATRTAQMLDECRQRLAQASGLNVR